MEPRQMKWKKCEKCGNYSQGILCPHCSSGMFLLLLLLGIMAGFLILMGYFLLLIDNSEPHIWNFIFGFTLMGIGLGAFLLLGFVVAKCFSVRKRIKVCTHSQYGTIGGVCACVHCGLVDESMHDWDGCKCYRCGQKRDASHDSHVWDGCTCTLCGQTRDEGHVWCIKTEVFYHEDYVGDITVDYECCAKCGKRKP